ncbi:hypothetical protein [Pedobacter arcticus]|uniref:hypothetical protein n=1 Tax=Pedobacter arcticus TaxID=752140 RepID=UPI0002EEB008|nr:hypothetical protein [Pedobacter arcticus]
MILVANFCFAQSQDIQNAPDSTYSYAYISVAGKVFSKKLKVEVDFGDTPEQIIASQDFSEYLTDKKSYAAVLNYMVGKQFELVNTLGLNRLSEGSGGTSGVVFIMKRKKELSKDKRGL